jgi:glycosyltransferase involved in cell wall biosynthesis
MTLESRTRLLYVISSLTRGGAERQLYLLLKHLDRREFDAAVVSLTSGGALAASIRRLGVPVTELPRRGRLDLRRLSSLCGAISAFAPHIVQTFMLADTLYGFLAGRWAGVPILVTSRRTEQYGEFPPMLRLVNGLVSRWADAVICNSRRAVDHLPAHLAARHVVIPNGVEPLPVRGSRAEVRRTLGVPPTALVVGTVGRMVPAKNHLRFVEVARDVIAQRPDCVFVLVGDGPREAEVRARIDALGLQGKLLLTGEREDVGDLLSAFDVFLLTSDREGLCNAVMEAMLSGLPCVVTDAGGNGELVRHRATGFVCPLTTAALSEGVLRLLADPALRHSFGTAGRGWMERQFGPTTVAQTTQGLYRRLLSASASTRGAARGQPGRESGAVKPIACLVGTFPTLTETFIVGEILELRRHGIPMVLYALGRSRGSAVQPDAVALSGEVRYAAPLWSPRLLAANARSLARAPRRYARALGLLVGRVWRNPVHLLKTLYLFPKAVEIGEHMARQGVGHVHAHWATYPTTAALVVSEVTGLPYSFTAHAGDVTLFRTLLAEKIRRARFVVTCTDDLRADLGGFLPASARDKVHLNYHGVALERFALVERNGSRPHPTIVACGGLYKRKGFADVVEACRILRDRGRDFHCVIVGDGPQRPRLEAQIAQAALGHLVRLTGPAPHSEVVRYYREGDVFVLPCSEYRLKLGDPGVDLVKVLEAWFEPAGGTIKDGIPNVLVEAMATGLPVVTTAISGIPELVRDGSNGLFVTPGNIAQLADVLDRLLTDGALRRRLGQRAAEDVRTHFDRRRHMVSLVGIFEHHLKNGRRPARAAAAAAGSRA